MSHSDIPSGK